MRRQLTQRLAPLGSMGVPQSARRELCQPKQGGDRQAGLPERQIEPMTLTSAEHIGRLGRRANIGDSSTHYKQTSIEGGCLGQGRRWCSLVLGLKCRDEARFMCVLSPDARAGPSSAVEPNPRAQLHHSPIWQPTQTTSNQTTDPCPTQTDDTSIIA